MTLSKALLLSFVLALCCCGFAQEDFGAQVNRQFAACTETCVVHLPPTQTVQWTNTISIPCASNSKITLSGDGPSTALVFSGAGPAIDLDCPQGNGAVDATISSFKLIVVAGPSNEPTAGIHLATFNGATLSDLIIENSHQSPMRAVDGILIEGANSITIRDVRVSGFKNGIHNVGILRNGRHFSANAIHVFGGEISGNSGCGIFEDGANARQVGANLGNSYIGITFEANGSDDDQSTGNACVQNGFGITFSNDYFETAADHTVPYQLWVGDTKNRADGVLLSGNTFASTAGTLATVNLANSDGATIIGNIEVAAIPAFVHQSKQSRRTFLYPNMFLAVRNAGNKPPHIPGVSGVTSGIEKIALVGK